MITVKSVDVKNDNFWETYPQAKLLEPFKSLHKNDKTRKKVSSSNLMWCVVCIWDDDSLFYGLPELGDEGKIALVFEEIMGDASYYEENIDKVDLYKEAYLKYTSSPAKRQLAALEKKLEERTKFLMDTEYSFGEMDEKGRPIGNTAKDIDSMLANSKKFSEQIQGYKKDIEKEASGETRVKGGGLLSMNSMGDI